MAKTKKHPRVPSKGKKIVAVILSTIVTLGLLGCIAFYGLIVMGLSPSLQTTWVCSAMNTFHHKYLATWFIPQGKIDRIMAENTAVDDGSNTDKNAISTPKKDETPTDTKTKEQQEAGYLAEGYEKLENGLYLKQVKGTGWQGYIMMIPDSTRVKMVDTKNQFSCGQTVMQMIGESGAIAGINGGGFNDGATYDSNGGSPSGIIIEDGNLINPASPSSNDVYNIIGMDKDGVFTLQHGSSQWAVDNGIVSAVSFSPFLIVNGVGQINGSGGWGIAPRTALGQRKTGEMLFLVIDGRQVGWSIGCDLDALQDTLLAEKCYNAAMLDGGSSTVMIYDNEFINRPALGFERYINNCWVVMPE